MSVFTPIATNVAEESEKVIKEVVVQGSGVCVTGRYYDGCEIEFQGEGPNDYLEFSAVMEYQLSAGANAPELSLAYRASVDDSSYVTITSFDLEFQTITTTPWSVTPVYRHVLELETSKVNTRVQVTDRNNGSPILAGTFKFRHVRKTHDFTLSTDFSQTLP